MGESLGGVALLEELCGLGFQKTGPISSEFLVSCIELNVTLNCCYSTMPAGLNHGGDEIVCIPLEPYATL